MPPKCGILLFKSHPVEQPMAVCKRFEVRRPSTAIPRDYSAGEADGVGMLVYGWKRKRSSVPTVHIATVEFSVVSFQSSLGRERRCDFFSMKFPGYLREPGKIH